MTDTNPNVVSATLAEKVDHLMAAVGNLRLDVDALMQVIRAMQAKEAGRT